VFIDGRLYRKPSSAGCIWYSCIFRISIKIPYNATPQFAKFSQQ
jgi:hypothetical protein